MYDTLATWQSQQLEIHRSEECRLLGYEALWLFKN
jgi:hypothetical protein